MGPIVNKQGAWISRLLNGLITGLFLGYSGFIFTAPVALGTKWIDTVHECGKLQAANLTHPACPEALPNLNLDSVAAHLQQKVDRAIAKSSKKFSIRVSVVSNAGLKFHLISKEKDFLTGRNLPETLTQLRRLAGTLNHEARKYSKRGKKIPTAWHITLATAHESELLSGALAVQYATKSRASNPNLPFFFPNNLRF